MPTKIPEFGIDFNVALMDNLRLLNLQIPKLIQFIHPASIFQKLTSNNSSNFNIPNLS